jgi:hypothetical protein
MPSWCARCLVITSSEGVASSNRITCRLFNHNNCQAKAQTNVVKRKI